MRQYPWTLTVLWNMSLSPQEKAMKRLYSLVLLTVFLGLNCGVSNARQDCLASLDETEFVQDPCLLLAMVSTDPNSQSAYGKSLTNVMLLNCAVNIQERAACNRKSNLPYPTLRN